MPGPGGRPDQDQNAGQSGGGQNGGGGNGGGQQNGNPYHDGTLMWVLYKAGFRNQGLAIAYAVAMAESGGNAQAHNGDASTGDNSYGLFQINMIGAMGPDRREQYNLENNAALYDPVKNARIAFQMSGGGKNWSAWTTYTRGTYEQYLDTGNSKVTEGGGNASAGGGGGDTNTTTTSDGGAYNSPEQDKLSARELAEESGWSYSFLKTQPELWKLFKQAVAGNWSPQKFASAMRDTKWFQSNSDTMRQAEVLRKTDPKTWDQRVASTAADVMDQARAMGAVLSQKEAEHIAIQSIRFGFSAGDLTNTMSDYVSRKNGSFVGQAGVNEDELRAYAQSMGVNVSPEYVKKVVSGMARGDLTFEEAQDRVDRWAMSAFPSLRDDIKNGTTVQELADPYIQTMASLLEINAGGIDLFTPKIRNALMSRDKDNKPATKTLWEFEQDVRKDDRFQYTKQATDAVDEIGMSILSDWGFN